ncbi:hypothetical protein EL22_11585 [Halostagnicola sp. A56]|uniref:hypothetical protein n=1 Tax=Halostagnicola sp. A56 TaxID=1495067 RepID=UPI00065F6A1C|nr:hypothetical protein [Halostagnicola sp. A56]KDE57527.2 hypothetical protein EL22_11585 [Halostagnicola sp. A56]
MWLPLGTIFSTLELSPLILILFEAMGQYRALATSGESFPYTLPFISPYDPSRNRPTRPSRRRSQIE